MWESMTIDEYAALESAHGACIVRVDGVWWRRVRPFFYQPLFPFVEIVPHSKKTPPGTLLGGYQHVVPGEEMANSRRHFFIWDALRDYSIDLTGHQTRSNIKKGMKHFTVSRIVDVEEFISAAHPVYLSFYERTKYGYKSERVNKKYFAQWARTLYRFPKVKIACAYYRGELSAVDISYLVENVLFAASFFGKTEHMKYQVVDLMAHEMRAEAAASPNISFILRGTVTGNRGVDGSKLHRGCKIVSKPAFYKLNPFADLVLRNFMKTSHKKLTGLDVCVQQVPEKPKAEAPDQRQENDAARTP